SISAEVLEKFFWWSCYAVPLALGSWRLQKMRVHTIEKSDVDNREYELRLHLNDGNHLDPQLNFAEEMEKLPVTNFSALELKFEPACHVYGALVLQLLQMHRICAATKKLKVDLTWSPKAREACQGNCPCHMPESWRSQSVFCTRLEEVEIHGFTGADHEQDFLTMIFKCSPMLKSMNVRLIPHPY
uniref:FBD domain-containing protein n=1 Tax=Aegilops tauschii subsp. strangulata TaxID=200361 RepID=A0A453JCF8_AEGTS